MAGSIFTSQGQPVSKPTNSGGLNSGSSPLSVADNEATDLINIDYNSFGSFIKRSGYSPLNTTAFNSGAANNGLAYFEMVSGTDYIVGAFGSKLAKQDSLDGTWDDITGALTLTAGNNNRHSFSSYRDTLLGTNGVDPVWKWTGTGNASAATVPTGLTSAKWVVQFFGYTWLLNVTVSGVSYKSRGHFSSPGTIDIWDSADWIDVARDNGQECTGAVVLGDKLVFFKERSIYIISYTGDPDIPFVVQKTPSHVGCASGHTIQEVNNGLIFLSQDGFYYFDGANSFKLSDKITPTLMVDMNQSRFQHAVAVYHKSVNRYICSMTAAGGSTHNRNIVFDTANKAWSVYSGLAANAYTNVYTSDGETVYFGDYSGYCYLMNTGTNDKPLNVTTAIPCYYKTKWFSFDDLVDQKGVPHVVVYYNYTNATMNFGYSFDFEDLTQYSIPFSLATSGSLYGTATYGSGTYAGSGGYMQRLDLTGRGRVVRFTFENNTASETFQINGFGAQVHLETHA